MDEHAGHRERLKNRYRSEGLDHFEEKQALELLLFYAVPRRDTEPIARTLLQHYGSLEAVLEAPESALTQVPGLGAGAATFLRLIADFQRYRQIRKNSGIRKLDTIRQCGEYLRPQFYGRRDELVCVLCLDANRKVLGTRILSEGTANSAGLPIRKLVEYAISVNATSVILAHNHPSGLALPSSDDLAATARAASALDSVGILLVDHLIYTGDDYVSLVESGLAGDSLPSLAL